MDSHLSEALEILDSFDQEANFKKELDTKVAQLKSNKKFKKQKSKHIEELKNKHGFNKTYNNKVIKINKFDAEAKRRKAVKQLISNKSKAPVDLERWCKLTGTPYAKKEQKEKEEEEETVFDDSLFEEFSRDFLGKPEQRRTGRQYRK